MCILLVFLTYVHHIVTAVFKGLHSLLATTRALMTKVKIIKAFSNIIKMGLDCVTWHVVQL